jgi:transcriptional regulator with XRE-family HTH domain
MTHDEAASLGAYLRAAREAAGLSLRQLAERAGVGHAYLSRLELGEQSNPTIEVLQKITQALSLDFDELLAKFGIKRPLPEPRVYFRRKFGVSEEDAEVMERLIEKYRVMGGSENGENIEE